MEAQATDSRSLRSRLERARSSARYGRLRARLPRYAFLAFVAVMCAAGVRSTIWPPASSAPAVERGLRVDYAEQSFALRFARVYLAYDSARPQAREAALAAFGTQEIGAGFTPPAAGSRRVQWADVAQVQRPLVGGAIVVVAAKLSTAPRPVYLSVPVARAGSGAIYLGGYPSFVGPPLATARGAERIGGSPVRDPEVAALVERALTNYLAGDAENLSADLAAAAVVTLPTNRLSLRSIGQLAWVEGEGGGAVLATVGAEDSRGGSYELRYEVGIRRVEAGDPQIGPGWRVTYVQTISHQS